MKVEFLRDLPIKAEQINNYYTFERPDKFDVSDIQMGQSGTRISITGLEGTFNSIHFKFYLWDREIDLQGSGLFNGYRWKSLPMIAFIK